ncbi:MAG: LuxR C-terminal-related transcriptional regulator, partial [Acinetobacter sp.]
AQHILDTISQKGLFVQALDEQRTWYRLHHFFRDFLQSKLKLTQADIYKQMHSKAAEWFKQHGFLMEAIYHVQQIEDEQLLLSLLNDVSRELIIKGRKYTLLELVKPLPEAILVKNPKLLYDVIWSLLLTHQSTLAHHYLQLWHSVDQHETLLKHEDQLGLAPLIALLEDKLALAYDLAQQNLEQLTCTAYFARAPLVGISVLYHICLGEVKAARKLILQTRIIYIQHHSVYGLAIADCFDALCDYLLGNLNIAAEKFDQIGLRAEYKKLGLDETNRVAINNICSSFKADLYYEMNQMPQTEAALSDFKGGEYFAVPDMVVVGYILQLRLATLQQDQRAVQACLNQVQVRSSQWSLSRVSETIHTYVHEGKGTSLDLKNIEQTTTKPFLNVTHLLRGDDLISVRTQIFTGHMQQAKQYLIQQLPFFRDYPLRQARIKLLLALAFYKLQQNDQAFDYLQQALENLMPTQAVRVVLDEHPLIWEMLNQFSKILALTHQSNVVELIKYIQYLFTLVTPQDMREREYVQTDSFCDKEILSSREIQIIEKLGMGLTDLEVADLLFLSVNTVKWHLRNIYNKLKVRSRLEAIIAAKKKGYIS